MTPEKVFLTKGLSRIHRKIQIQRKILVIDVALKETDELRLGDH